MVKDNQDFTDKSVLKLDLGRFFQAEWQKEVNLDIRPNATKAQKW